MDCPEENVIVDFARGELGKAERARVEAHIDECGACSQLVAEMARIFADEPEDPASRPPQLPISRPSQATLATDGAFSPSSATIGGGDKPPEQILPQGAKLGRYVVIDRVGAGGMGVVYAAYDPELDRKVALKVLRSSPKKHARNDQSARLIREAQAMAKLSHPNVITVHDVGTFEEQVFIAMEFIDGGTLGQWLAKERRTWRDILKVFRAAGEGLEAAHEGGLVHRDFKPDNVLMGNDGRVLVTDFGLARPAAGNTGRFGSVSASPSGQGMLQASLTQTGALVGTPAYMAPEQLHGRSTNAVTDQFSFCVTLYEALYGVRPFSATKRKELLESKSTMAIRSPPGDRHVPGGLRKIVVRGMAADPARRWPSVETLLRALESLLARRRRVATVAGIAALATVASLGAVGTSHDDPCADNAAAMDHAWSDERRAELAAEFAGSGAGTGVQTWERLDALFDDYATRWRSGRQDACRAHRGGDQSATLLDRRMACLDEALRNLEGTLQTLADVDAEVVMRADKAARELPPLSRCADVDAMLADVAPPQDAELAAQVDTVRDAIAGARARLEAGKLVDGLTRATEAAQAAAETGYEPVAAEAQLLMGRAQARMGKDEASAASLDEAFGLAMASGHDRIALSASMVQILVVGHKLGQPNEALARRTLIEALLERLDAPPADRARAAEAIGSALRGARRLDEAHDQLAAALVIRREHAEEDPLGLANALNNYGNLLRDLERYDDSVAAFEESIALATGVLGDNHLTIASTISNLVSAEIDRGRGAEALELAERAWKIFSDALGPEHGQTAEALGRLGGVRWLHGAREQAVIDVGESVRLLERERGPEHRSTVTALSNYGALLVYLDRFEEARSPLQRALAVAEADEHGRSGGVEFLSMLMGQLEAGLGNRAEARRHADRAYAVVEERDGRDSAKLVGPLELLAELAESEGDVETALSQLRRAIAIAGGTEVGGRLRARLHASAGAMLGRHDEWEGAVEQYVLAEQQYTAATTAGDDSPTTRSRLEDVRRALAEARAHGGDSRPAASP